MKGRSAVVVVVVVVDGVADRSPSRRRHERLQVVTTRLTLSTLVEIQCACDLPLMYDSIS